MLAGQRPDRRDRAFKRLQARRVFLCLEDHNLSCIYAFHHMLLTVQQADAQVVQVKKPIIFLYVVNIKKSRFLGFKVHFTHAGMSLGSVGLIVFQLK